jgi:hypothetical protein
VRLASRHSSYPSSHADCARRSTRFGRRSESELPRTWLVFVFA